jgi:glycosyltransferase involved in cell wall biosynthesis
LCAAGDVEGMAAAVARLLGDPALRRRIADAARAEVGEFDAEAMVRAQEAVYRELLAQR